MRFWHHDTKLKFIEAAALCRLAPRERAARRGIELGIVLRARIDNQQHMNPVANLAKLTLAQKVVCVAQKLHHDRLVFCDIDRIQYHAIW